MKKKKVSVFDKEKHKLNPHGCKPDFKKIANTRHLTRILTYLSCVDYASQTKIQTSIGVETEYLKDAINFLVNHKIIFIINFKRDGAIKRYMLNPLFKK